MNARRFWAGWVAVYVVYWVLAFLIHQVLLGPRYLALTSVWRPEAEMMARMWIMWVTSAVWTLLFCYIFTRGYEGKGAMEGVRYGALIGVFSGFTYSYETYVTFPIPLDLAHLWFASGMVMSIILGLAFALIYRPAKA